MDLILQEVSTEREIEIPEPVGNLPSVEAESVGRARRLEKALDTPAKIYYKYEGVSPTEPQTEHRGGSGFYNKRRESNASPPKPARDSGVLHWPLQERYSG